MWQSGVSFSGVVTGIDVEADEVVVVVATRHVTWPFTKGKEFKGLMQIHCPIT
jgi:hypothetical protein